MTSGATQMKEKGNAYFKKGQHAEAIECYTFATEMDPNNPVFFTNRSTAYFKMEKYDKSFRDAEKAVARDKTWAKGYYRKGLVYQQKEKYKEGCHEFDQAIFYARQNKNKSQEKLFTTCYDECKKKMYKGMSSADILKGEGNLLFKGGDCKAAIKKYTEGIKKAENNAKDKLVKADLYANRAACHRQEYNAQECIKDCTEALKLNPGHVKAYIRRAQSYESLEKYKEALTDYQASIFYCSTPVAIQGAGRCKPLIIKQQKLNKKK